MDTLDFENNIPLEAAENSGQKGSALVVAVLILALISMFVALALSRSSAEAASVGNETAEGRTFYAAQGSLETMTRNFNKIFEVKINPTEFDLNTIRNGTVPLPSPSKYTYSFLQEVDRTSNSIPVVLTDDKYAGLYAIRDNWQLVSTTTDPNGVQVKLTRNLLNNRIPIFQFGIFYDDDLELYRPPRFSFGGRVHSNGHFFVSPGPEGIYFDSRVTAVGQIITQTWRNGYTGDSANDKTYIKNASRVDKQLLPSRGSALNTSAGATNNIFADKPDMPPSKLNTSWTTQSGIFDGNLQTTGKPDKDTRLNLPVKIGTTTDLIEMIRRGKKVADSNGGDLFRNSAGTLAPVVSGSADDDVLRSERFANKTGIRVSLADGKAKLPGCASGAGTAAISTVCGVRLDGSSDGSGSEPLDGVRGYTPKAMASYQATRLNGNRLYVSGREVWIKVETVRTNPTTGLIETKDITHDILSLGVTEQAPDIGNEFEIDDYDESPMTSSLTETTAQPVSGGPDSRSIIKLQRFVIEGPAISGGSTSYLSSFSTSTKTYNAVVRYAGVDSNSEILTGCVTSSVCTQVDADHPDGGYEHLAHVKRATVDNNTSSKKAVVPFPIKMFDTREGTYYDLRDDDYYDSLTKITRNGLMSMIDIDIANLRRFLRGDFNNLFPAGTPFALGNLNVPLKSTDIPQREGWVLYISDRRGDADFDGEFDMEDIYSSAPGNIGGTQVGEDVNNNGILDDNSYGVETEKYNVNTIEPDLGAVTDHKYYRRGVRLIRGTTLPGIYDAADSANTRGFTVASENGVYVKGNYNATGAATPPTTGNTAFNNYSPNNTATHIPASIVADGVTVLSNAWNDAQSFTSPYNQDNRLATNTTIRFALISGDTVSSKEATPNQGGLAPNLNGGVHNFKRFLEKWTGDRLDYSGSLINLFNSRNNNGSFKCCNTVYDPPIRNWVFDSTFLDPARLPPGTPFFQYVQTTGFLRTND